MANWADPVMVKVLTALGLWCATLMVASIPVVLSRRSFSQRRSVTYVLTGMSCLGGGVFLATCFLHLLPEAVEVMGDALKNSKKEIEFPVPYAIVVAGFLLVLIAEQAMLTFNKGNFHLGHSHGPARDDDRPVPVPNYGAIHRNAVLADSNNDSPNQIGTIEDTAEDSDDEDRMTTVSMHGDPGSHTAFRAIILVFALSLHSIFEGLAIGIENSTPKITQLLVAIALHKSVIAITLSTKLVSSSTRLSIYAVYAALIVFSSMAPVGIIIGLQLDGAPPLVNGALQCIATGTFVYITFFEILPHELNSESTKGSRLYKVIMLLLGIGLVVVLMLVFPDHDHDHSRDNHDNVTTSTMPTSDLTTLASGL